MMSAGAVHILVVDDEAEICMLLRRCFEREGYSVTEARNGRDLFRALEKGAVHLITLDLGLGGEDGLELARRVRAKRNVPIVMISGKGDTIDRVVGLELGADDYITKPFHLREVLARVRAVLRRYEMSSDYTHVDAPPSSDTLKFDRWRLDTARRELRDPDGTEQELTTAEFNLLDIFLNRPRRVMSRDNIMDLLKGADWSPVDRTIDNLIARLRRKIEPDPEKPQLIKTVRGVGYIFTGEVEKN